jgi:hypothetical protein
MSMHEIAEQLIRSFDESAQHLQTMRTELEQRRAQWVSARPSTLAAPATTLEAVQQQLTAADAARAVLFANAANLLPAAPGVTAADRHIDVSRIAALLPFGQASRLRKAAKTASDLARAVRGEVALGNRLLAFAQRAQDSVLGSVAHDRDDVGSYDRNARRVHAALTTQSAPAGSLIDGRM